MSLMRAILPVGIREIERDLHTLRSAQEAASRWVPLRVCGFHPTPRPAWPGDLEEAAGGAGAQALPCRPDLLLSLQGARLWARLLLSPISPIGGALFSRRHS